jgi:DNA-binding transcriptional LysR family regulator
MLNLSRLQMLHQLSVLGTISAVAGKRNLTRPAVSKQLAQLEHEVGTALFERTGRTVQLTAAGRRLVARASSLFELVEDIEAEFTPSRDTVSGEVTIAAFASLLTSLLPNTLSRLIKSHPKLDIIFHEMEPANALRAAAASQVDLALVDDQVSGEEFADSLEFRPLYVDQYGALLSASHPLARKRSIRLTELKHERWAMGQEGAARYRFLLNACHAAGFAPHVVSRSVNFAVRLEMVRTGYVVAVLPWLALRLVERDRDFRLLQIHPPLMRRIFVALPRGSSRRPAIAAVLQSLQRAAAVNPDRKRKG